MKTALLIQGYPSASQRIKDLWRYYKKSGFDIFGVDTEDGSCNWPEHIHRKAIGKNAYIEGGHLSQKLCDCVAWFLSDPIFTPYTHVCVIENDVIFLKPPPAMDVEITSRLAGFQVLPMKALKFWHNPWWMSREIAVKFVAGAKELLAAGENELGHPDFFFGLVCERYNLPVVDLPGAFSQNSFDNQYSLEIGRKAVREGAWVVHGVKTLDQLKYITT